MPGARPGRTYLFAFGLILLAAVAVGQTMYDIWAQDGPYTRLTDLKATAPGATTPTLTLGGVRVPTTGNFKAGTGVTVSTSGGDVTYSSTASTGDYLTSASVTATSPITATPGAGTVAIAFDTTWPPLQGYITTGTLTGGWPVSVAVGGNNEALIGLDPAFSTIISDTLTPSGLHSEDPIEIETDTAEATFTLSDAANTSIGLAHAQNTDTGSSAATFTVNDLAADNATVTGQVNAFYLGATNGIQTSGTASATTVAATTVNATNVTATNQVNAYYLGSTNSIQTSGPVTAASVSAPTVSATNVNTANVVATGNIDAAYLGSSGDVQASGTLRITHPSIPNLVSHVRGEGFSILGDGNNITLSNTQLRVESGTDPFAIECLTVPLRIGATMTDGATHHIGYGWDGPEWDGSAVRYNHEFHGSIGNDNRIETTGPLVCDGEVNAFYVGTTNSIQTSGTLDATTVNAPTVAATNVTATNNVSATNNVTAAYLGSSGDVQATGTVTAGTLSAPTISGTNASVANLTASQQVKAMYLGSSGAIQSSGSLTALGAANGHGAANTGSYAHEFTGAIGLMDSSASITGATDLAITLPGKFGVAAETEVGLNCESGSVLLRSGGGNINANVPVGYFTAGDGGTTDYTAINGTGHQTMVGAATVWDDVTVPGFDVRVAGVSDPAWAKFKDNGTSSTGVYLWWFDPGTLQQVYFTIQLPHKWKEGSAIKPHVHWVPEVTADGAPANQTVEWGLEYTKASIGGTYGNTTLVYAKAHAPADANVIAGKHYTTDFADITMSGNTISTILVCRLFRNATDATDDTYEHDAGFLAFDIHVECDSIGSDTDTAK